MKRIPLAAAWILGVLALAPAARAGLSVPAGHPRICIDRERLETLKGRLAEEPWRGHRERLLAAARAQRGQLDPRRPFGRLSGQSRRLASTGALATLSLAALLGDEDSARALDAFFADFTLDDCRAELPADELMPRGELLEGYALALDWCWNALSPGARERLAAEVRSLAADIHSGFVTRRTWEATVEANNHSMAAAGPLGLAALALYHEEPEARAWFALVEKKVRAWFEQSWDPDGAYYEGPLYADFGLLRCLDFAVSLREFGGPDLLKDRLPGIVSYFTASFLPGMGALNNLNDSSGGFTGTFVLYAASALKDGRARWLWERANLPARIRGSTHPEPYLLLWDDPAVEPVDPGAGTRLFRGRGLVYVRTGYGPDDVLAHFESGERRAGCHCQGDQNHFTFYALGERFAVDTGYSNKAREGTANQSVGHNLLLVDGKGQAVSGEGKIVTGRLAFFRDLPALVAATGDATQAYGRDGYNPVLRAHRTFLFMKARGFGPYAVVVDDLRVDSGAHAFDWLLHTWPGNRVETGEDRAEIVGGQRGGRLTVGVPWPPKATLKVDRVDFGRPSIPEHPVLHVAWTGALGIAVVVLCPRVEGEPELAWKAAAFGDQLTVTLTRGPEKDTILFRDVGAERGFSPLNVAREGAGLKKVSLAVRPR